MWYLFEKCQIINHKVSLQWAISLGHPGTCRIKVKDPSVSSERKDDTKIKRGYQEPSMKFHEICLKQSSHKEEAWVLL